MCSSSGSGKSDSKEKSLYGVSWNSNSTYIALISLLGSLHFLGSLGLFVTWAWPLDQSGLLLLGLPLKLAIEVPSELVEEEGSV